jgi:hypothetical protein
MRFALSSVSFSLVTLAAVAVRASSWDRRRRVEHRVQPRQRRQRREDRRGPRRHAQRCHEFRVKKLEIPHGHCGSQKWHQRSTIATKRLETSTYDAVEASAKAAPNDKISVPAVKDFVWLTATFAAMHIYNECDRFAFAIQLEVDGKPKPIELELRIKRNDPKN